MSELEKRALELKKSFDLITSHFQAVASARSGEELSLQDLKIVNFLGQRKSCIMREVAEHLQVAVSTMTGLIDKLEDKDIVKRERNDEDRRIVKVLLTNKGIKIFQSYCEDFLGLNRKMLQSLNEQEQILYLELTKKIAREVSQHTELNSGK